MRFPPPKIQLFDVFVARVVPIALSLSFSPLFSVLSLPLLSFPGCPCVWPPLGKFIFPL